LNDDFVLDIFDRADSGTCLFYCKIFHNKAGFSTKLCPSWLCYRISSPFTTSAETEPILGASFTDLSDWCDCDPDNSYEKYIA